MLLKASELLREKVPVALKGVDLSPNSPFGILVVFSLHLEFEGVEVLLLDEELVLEVLDLSLDSDTRLSGSNRIFSNVGFKIGLNKNWTTTDEIV